jgi:hypothetical protein
VNSEQRRLARHALGLGDTNRSYRNRFYASKDTPNEREWRDLVSRGLAISGREDRGLIGFCLTEAGATMVLESKEMLDPEEFPGSPRAWKRKK